MTQNKKVKIGIIGGSGLDDPKIFKEIERKKVKTPFGFPSDDLVMGKINNKDVIILGRHGRNHTLTPTQVPYQANIWALHQEGCGYILATTACGSLKEEMKPGDLVFLDQFIDWTKRRELTFFNDKVIHTPMADPFDKDLRGKLINASKDLGFDFHPNGTMITIEGPRFSSRAESLMFKQWGAELINMSTVPEVTLANELGIKYQSIAMVTDYDCWKENEESVSFELILKRMSENADKVKILLIKVVGDF